MRGPWRAVSSETIAGRMLPSRWRCSSALGRERRCSGKGLSGIRANLARKLRLAGVFPGGKPEGADVGGGVGKLANQDCGGLIVKAIVVFVGVRVEAAARIAVGEENSFEPTVGTKAGFEGVVGRIGDEHGVVGTHGEEGAIAVDEGGAEAVVDAMLARKFAVVVVRGVEGIVRGGDVVGEDGRVEARLVPLSGAHGVGEFFAVDADLPREQAVSFEFCTAEFQDRGFVFARQRFEREATVFLEDEILSAALRRSLDSGSEWVVDVLEEKAAATLEKWAAIRSKQVRMVRIGASGPPGARKAR